MSGPACLIYADSVCGLLRQLSDSQHLPPRPLRELALVRTNLLLAAKDLDSTDPAFTRLGLAAKDAADVLLITAMLHCTCDHCEDMLKRASLSCTRLLFHIREEAHVRGLPRTGGELGRLIPSERQKELTLVTAMLEQMQKPPTERGGAK